MRLIKKINNNVALGADDNGHTIVVFGKGVGFHRMPHEVTPDDEVQRVFYDVSNTLVGSLDTLDSNVLLASSDIVDLAKMELEGKLNPNLPFTLADHVQFAIQRYKQNIQIENPLAADVAFVYPAELRIARTGVGMINRRVPDADLPEDEAYAIALHIVNGEVGGAGDESTIDVVSTTAKIMTHVTAIMERQLDIKVDHESYAYTRFVSHFRYLVGRLMKGEEEQSSSNSSLFEQAAQDFPEIFSCVKKIDDYLGMVYGWSLSNEELLYLMMHVNRFASGR